MQSNSNWPMSVKDSFSVVSTAEEQAELLFGGDQAVEHLLELSLDEDGTLKYWSIFYCGGSVQIESDLRATTRKYGIGDLALEYKIKSML